MDKTNELCKHKNVELNPYESIIYCQDCNMRVMSKLDIAKGDVVTYDPYKHYPQNRPMPHPGSITKETKMNAIYINGLLMTITDDTLTYEQVCQLAPKVTAPRPTVQYTRGGSDKPSGVLLPGQAVALRDGMNFDVAFTGFA
jgi:hypothetical protein